MSGSEKREQVTTAELKQTAYLLPFNNIIATPFLLESEVIERRSDSIDPNAGNDRIP